MKKKLPEMYDKFKKAKANIETKNPAYMSKITVVEKTLLEKLMLGVDDELNYPDHFDSRNDSK